MADDNGSGQAPDQNAAANPPAAANPAASSLPETDFDTRVRGAKTLADIKALKEEALKPRAAKPPETPPAGTTPAGGTPPDLAKPQGEGDPAAPGAGDATPAPEAGDNPPPPTDPEAGAEEDDLDLGEADGTLTYKQIRLTPPQDDKVGRLAGRLMKRNRDWKMEQAIEAARERLGIKPPQPDPAAANTPGAPQLPQTVDEVNATLKRLKAEKLAHNVGLRFEEAGAIEEQIDQLMEHRSTLQQNAARAETEKASAYQTAWAAADAKAVTLYPFASDPNSAGAKRMLEIDADLKANGDPLYHSPDKPLKLAQMAAAELNIAPARKGTTPAPKPPAGAAPAVIAPKRQVLPTGGSQSTPAPANTPPADVARVTGIKTLADLRAERKRLGLPE
jgi:hypothetical protein